jgi:hypothetical protein
MDPYAAWTRESVTLHSEQPAALREVCVSDCNGQTQTGSRLTPCSPFATGSCSRAHVMRGAPSQRRPAWSRCLQTTRGQINSLLLICARPQLCCLGSGPLPPPKSERLPRCSPRAKRGRGSSQSPTGRRCPPARHAHGRLIELGRCLGCRACWISLSIGASRLRPGQQQPEFLGPKLESAITFCQPAVSRRKR